MEQAALANATALSREIVASNLVREEDVYRAIAYDLDVPFLNGPIEPDRLVVDERVARTCLSRSGPAFFRAPDGELKLVLAPPSYRRELLTGYLSRYPAMADRLLITSPSLLRQALLKRLAPDVAERAANALSAAKPDMSARFGLSGWQGALVASFCLCIPLGLAISFEATLALAHIFFTLFFLSCVLLRIKASRLPVPTATIPPAYTGASPLPTYSVLVACYREAKMADQIVEQMSALDWPASKLEVKLVCEDDDLETIEAFEALDLPAHFEILRVPVHGPRTKPKALNFALACISGSLVVIYDAEDRPHPMQLREAWDAFSKAPRDVACLQAPLVITNGNRSWLANMFAHEYAALFSGLLPYLSSRGLMLPLGGTSNHFRRAALESVGGWDPHNLTEDADLGVRLRRHGLRTGMITLPTCEDAPESLRDWLPQRTRWLKGYIQTWFVHMRAPSRLRKDLGRDDFLLAQVLFAGHVGSALVHPFMLLVMASSLASYFFFGHASLLAQILAFIDCANVALGYLAFHHLARRTYAQTSRSAFALGIPLYWTLLALAAWRACWKLYRAPFQWEKTTHTPTQPPAGGSAPPVERPAFAA